MIEYALMVCALVVALASLLTRDLMKAVIIGTGIEGLALALLFQMLLAGDVALTQVVISSAIIPGLFAIAVYKTQRRES